MKLIPFKVGDYNNVSSRFWGINTSHNPLSLWVMDQVLYALKPRAIIELGTMCGGLTTFLAGWSAFNYCVEELITVDINSIETNIKGLKNKRRDGYLPLDTRSIDDDLKTTNIILKLFPVTEFLIGDCLNEAGTIYQKIKTKMTKQPIFFYCDNGCKLKELKLYSPLIPGGSIIGTHDFGSEVPREFSDELVAAGFDVFYKDHGINTLTQYWIKNE